MQLYILATLLYWTMKQHSISVVAGANASLIFIFQLYYELVIYPLFFTILLLTTALYYYVSSDENVAFLIRNKNAQKTLPIWGKYFLFYCPAE